MQQTLAALTGVPLSDQILMCDGARLDPTKPLYAYGLPAVSPEAGWAAAQHNAGANCL